MINSSKKPKKTDFFFKFEKKRFQLKNHSAYIVIEIENNKNRN